MEFLSFFSSRIPSFQEIGGNSSKRIPGNILKDAEERK